VIRKYFAPLARLLVKLVIGWLIVDVLIAIAVHVHGQRVQLQQADVIIVLGSGLNRDGSAGKTLTRRAIQATRLWKQGHAPAILCSGGRTPGFRQSEAAACREALLANGVAEAAIHLEEQSHSTEENALHSRPVMRAQGWQSSLLVTDSFHMLRASWIFDGYGIPHSDAPVPANQIATGWYFNRIGREVLALQWQAVKKLLHLPATAGPVD
jgi:uncharacterized SAM-binding protein YcdF (DUF218 family)